MDELEPHDVGFNTIEATIDDKTAEQLCCIYVEHAMHPASQSLFDDLMAEGVGVKYALYCAVINQSVIEALLEDLDSPDRLIPPFDI